MSDPSFNYSYTPTVEHRESNLFREEYYSGTDVKIYFDDEEQTEIGYISYELQEQLKPVYGYNSRTFDDVVIGNRIVTGSFTVPIKNTAKQNWDKVESSSYSENHQNEIEKYNNLEKDNLYNTDWFGTTAKTIRSKASANTANDEYATKLIALGYNLNLSKLTKESFQKAVGQFQKDVGLTVTKELNTITKDRIDDKIEALHAEQIDLTGLKGHLRANLSDQGKNLSGYGLILSKIKTEKGLVYYVVDNNGKKYYTEGE